MRSVQPRVCGERVRAVDELDAAGGSAPRVRGTDTPQLGIDHGHRFSPACAGNGRIGQERVPAPAVQPRVCGERALARQSRFTQVGSAPRVRGTGILGNHDREAQRFSPACAGNGISYSTSGSAVTVQPRVCGERFLEVRPYGSDVGSAPRVRGTGGLVFKHRRFCRFSPACAGNGTRHASAVPMISVQPRVCGERGTAGSVAGRGRGSAPRVRGTARRKVGRVVHGRFSPACAGNGVL